MIRCRDSHPVLLARHFPLVPSLAHYISCCFPSYRKPSSHQLYNQVTIWQVLATAAQLYSTASSSDPPHTVSAHSASIVSTHSAHSSRHFALNFGKVRINTYASSHSPYQHILTFTSTHFALNTCTCLPFALNTYTSTQFALNTCN